jgi:hypothetical protein
MLCEYCGYPFDDGEHVTRIYRYWKEEHLGGEAYSDGVKPIGWAHIYCNT